MARRIRRDQGMRVVGDEALEKTLLGLPDKIYNKVVKSAANKAMTPVRRDARKNAAFQDRTGLLRKAIAKKAKNYKRTKTSVVLVGVSEDFRQTVTLPHTEFSEKFGLERIQIVNPAKYAHLVEFGTRPHPIPKSGLLFGKFRVQHPGTPPRPFLRPAFDNNQAKILSIYKKGLRTGIEREAKKAAAKAAKAKR